MEFVFFNSRFYKIKEIPFQDLNYANCSICSLLQSATVCMCFWDMSTPNGFLIMFEEMKMLIDPDELMCFWRADHGENGCSHHIR